MRTATLLHSTLNKGKYLFIFRSPSVKMLDIYIPAFIQEQSPSSCTYSNNAFEDMQKRRQLYTLVNDNHYSIKGSSVGRNYRRLLFCIFAFTPFDMPYLKNYFSSDSDSHSNNGNIFCGNKSVPSAGSIFKGKDNGKGNTYGSDNFRAICKLLKLGEENMEEKLSEINGRLSPQLVIIVLRNTSEHADSALRFFKWTKTQPHYDHSSAVYNEMLNIAGGSGDFEAFGYLIKEMIAKGHSLTGRALSFMLSSPTSISSVTEGLVDTLCKLGYMAECSTLASFLSRQNFHGIAMWVLQKVTGRGKSLNVSYYNVLIAEKCRRECLLEARRLLDEMKKVGCEPNTKSYNFLLGTLCKGGKIVDAWQLLDLMDRSGCQPDAITYEILICCTCKTGNMAGALELLDKMTRDGLRPRFSTHAAFIKGYFYAKQFEEAYNFVIETSKKDPSADSMNYMLLASLFVKSGMMLDAQGMLLKMTEKCLIPNLFLCRKVSQGLLQSGKPDMAQELQYKFNEIRNTLNKTVK